MECRVLTVDINVSVCVLVTVYIASIALDNHWTVVVGSAVVFTDVDYR
jgi:hypothetical protein